MKKDIMITIRLSGLEKDAVEKIKKADPSFRVSKFLRDSLIVKANGLGNIEQTKTEPEKPNTPIA